MYPDDFNKYFALSTSRLSTRPHAVEHSREYVAFFTVRRTHKDDAILISEDPSSALKASYLSSSYFLPPFLSCPLQNFKLIV